MFNLSQTEINKQRQIQNEEFWERRRREEEMEELSRKAQREGEEEARRQARKPVVYYRTNLKCLVKLEQLSTDKFRCPTCSEFFIRDRIFVQSSNGIEATSDYKGLRKLEIARDSYLDEARKIKKKLQVLEEARRQARNERLEVR